MSCTSRRQTGCVPTVPVLSPSAPLSSLSFVQALSTRRGDPFASQTSVSFIPDVVELPEIPFIAPTPTSSTSCDDEDEDSLWPDSMQRSASNSSSERQIAVLGQASPRAVSHTRGRSGSLSSTASRPAPARSILSSSSSIKTRKGRAPPSVKFLDMPTIHYDEDEDTDGPRSHAAWPTSRPARSAPPSATAPSKKRVFGILNWLTSPAKKKAKTAPTRPSISGPFPLCEAPSRRSSDSSRPCDSAMDARSIRSVRSTSSMRSVRSCASRIQGYWGRLSGKDP